MADDKKKRGQADRTKVAKGDTYEVSYFAAKHGLSKNEAEDLMKKVGSQRDALDKAADTLKRAKKR